MTTTDETSAPQIPDHLEAGVVEVGGVPIESYGESRGGGGHVYPSGVRVGDAPMKTQQEVDQRVAAGEPEWWPAVYLSDDGLVDLPGECRLTREQFRRWLAACNVALDS